MKKDTLMDMVCCMTQDVGLVHQMPFTCDQNGVPAVTLEKIQFGASNARMYLLANAVGINCAIGMSELIRKHILDESGGLKVFAKYQRIATSSSLRKLHRCNRRIRLGKTSNDDEWGPHKRHDEDFYVQIGYIVQ